METTFMTIHNLHSDASIQYASESIVDVLGYSPEEVVGKSCFDYFHPDEVPFARGIHSRGVMLDKASVLHYARIKDCNGNYVGCECVFSVVHDVLVACTSVYKGDEKSRQRAAAAPAIRRLFTSAPRDPRYHMLEHLSARFRTAPEASVKEPRAALILNRFTRTLTVMYATNAVASILGVSAEQVKDKSFYECIQENCLPDAIRCLESAKANDSIAYLRFWYRDPRRPEDLEEELLREASAESSDSDDGGVDLRAHMDIDSAADSMDGAVPGDSKLRVKSENGRGSSISGEGTDPERDSFHSIFDQAQAERSSTSSVVMSQRGSAPPPAPAPAAAARPQAQPFEIEAVVSCTSDGLVVILRRARPAIINPVGVAQAQYVNGLFAAPWGVNPIRPHEYQPGLDRSFQHGFQAPVHVGPVMDDFMTSIRDVAVFAWSLAGINGNVVSYGHGTPRHGAQPANGLPIWDPYAAQTTGFVPPENQQAFRWSNAERYNATYGPSVAGNSARTFYQFGLSAGLQRPHVRANNYNNNNNGPFGGNAPNKDHYRGRESTPFGSASRGIGGHWSANPPGTYKPFSRNS